MKLIRCDGNCGREWPESRLGTNTGPAIQITRVDGMGGGGYKPDFKDSLHVCDTCAKARLAWTLTPRGASRG